MNYKAIAFFLFLVLVLPWSVQPGTITGKVSVERETFPGDIIVILEGEVAQSGPHPPSDNTDTLILDFKD